MEACASVHPQAPVARPAILAVTSAEKRACEDRHQEHQSGHQHKEQLCRGGAKGCATRTWATIEHRKRYALFLSPSAGEKFKRKRMSAHPRSLACR